jgi:hypothetical protein
MLMKIFGILLIFFGLMLTVVTSTMVFTEEKVLDIGTVEVVRNSPQAFSWTPMLGILVVLAGGMFWWRGSRTS